MSVEEFHSQTILANLGFDALVIGVAAAILLGLFEWRDLRRRRALSEANRRIAVDARFVELSQDLAMTMDFERNIVSCNRAWEEQMGVTLEDFQSEPFGTRLHPDELADANAALEKMASGATDENTPWRFLHKDGSWRWLEWNSIGSPEDRLVFASARDVTKRVELEQALENERRQLRSAQEIARIGSWNLEVASGEMFWSDTTYELLSIEKPEGMPDAKLWLSSLDPAEHERGQARLADAIKFGGEFTFDFQRAQPDIDGEPVYIATKGFAEQDDNGRTTRLVGTIVDITERKRYEARLKFIADHDPLTGLPNRRKLDDVLDRHIAECGRYGPRGAVMVIDLDYLKRVNDRYGHVAGDDMIKCIADTLHERIRDTDIAARIGGDEFAVLLTKTTPEGARLVARSLIERLAESTPGLREAGVETVSASIGFAMIAEVEGFTSDRVMAAADDAMYSAKRAGTGNVREYRPRGHLSSVA